MIDREKVIKALELCTSKIETRTQVPCETCPYHNTKYHGVLGNGCCNMRSLQRDALALLKEQQATINELYTLYDGLCKEIREKYEGDDVCGLCQYDGAYVGESGDWMNECPGFETNECFCMKNSIRKMCGQPLIEGP